MGSDYLADPAVFLVQAVLGIVMLLLLLRFLLQLCHADFYNPLSQLVMKVTQPVLQPLRRAIPGSKRVDGASLLVLLIVQVVTLLIVAAMRGLSLGPGGLLFWSLAELVTLVINVYFVTIIVQALLSWFNPGRTPLSQVLQDLNRPLLRPVQRLVPPMSGIDLSPLVVLLGLQVAKMLLVPPLIAAARSLG
ncbi:MAG: YggT family protein [Gammaproteobacteria bacterium]|nr:YggT family protein [Gammaproteobacteria bacterium]